MATSATFTPADPRLSWSAAIRAGLLAGAVFMVLEMVMVPVFLGGSAWAPPRLIAAIGLGRGVLPPPATFDLTIVLMGLLIHFALSVLFTVVLAVLLPRVGAGAPLLVGALYGLALYLVNFYGFTALFPWFAMARNWVTIVTHLVFGAVAAWAYLRYRGTTLMPPISSVEGGTHR